MIDFSNMNTTKESEIIEQTEESALILPKNMNELVHNKEIHQDPLAMIASLITQPDLNIDVLDRMLDLQIKTMNHQAKIDFADAKSRFASIKKPIPHNRHGTTAGNAPFSYADYPQMVKFVDPWISQCGLSHSHIQGVPVIEGGEIVMIDVVCEIKHTGGHCETFSFPAVPDERLRGKVSPSQLIQLAITYAKRQTLAMGLGLATEEDASCDDGMKVAANNNSGKTITPGQIKLLNGKLERSGLTDSELCKAMKVKNIEAIAMDDVNTALDWIKDPK